MNAFKIKFRNLTINFKKRFNILNFTNRKRRNGSFNMAINMLMKCTIDLPKKVITMPVFTLERVTQWHTRRSPSHSSFNTVRV